MATQKVVMGDHALSASRKFAENKIRTNGFGIVGAAILQDVLNSGATRCGIAHSWLDDTVEITVEDNRPQSNGLAASLKQLSTVLNASSTIRGIALPLALAKSAVVETAQGSIELDGSGFVQRGQDDHRQGFRLALAVACDAGQYGALVRVLDNPLVLSGLTLAVNGRDVPSRTPIGRFEAVLPADPYGPDKRRCSVEVHEVLPGETAAVFEQGLLVQNTGDRWHYNVLGPVPRLWADRIDSRFVRHLRLAVLAEMLDKLDDGDARAEWIRQSVADEDCPADVFVWWLRARFGDKIVKSSSYSPQADGRARDHGYRVLEPGHLMVGQSLNLARFCDVPMSIDLFDDAADPCHRIISGLAEDEWDVDAPEGFVDVDGDLLELLPDEEYTRPMRAVAEYARGLAHYMLSAPLTLRFVRDPGVPPFLGADCWCRASDECIELFFAVDDAGRSLVHPTEAPELDDVLVRAFKFTQEYGLADVHGGPTLDETPYVGVMKQLALRFPEWVRSIDVELL